ncbi:MAG TPA: RNA polymerase sigma factor [Balneolales bacterium]|nr:RNA polymerase sigma factor [Balneolales bacterium]
MNTTSNHDNLLIERILAGERDLYRELIDRYSPMIFHLLRSYIREEYAVQDLAQEVFIKAFNNLSTFGFQSKFSSWIYRIAVNQCKDYLKNVRRKNITLSSLDSKSIDSLFEEDASQLSELVNTELHEKLKTAIDLLPDVYRNALLLKYMNDMTYKAMSEELGDSVESLKVRVHRARNELKSIMDQML